jgi:hypothetical protein
MQDIKIILESDESPVGKFLNDIQPLKYNEKLIDTLELWKTEKRKKKDKIIIDLTKVFNEFQLKQFFLVVIMKFDSNLFEADH